MPVVLRRMIRAGLFAGLLMPGMAFAITPWEAFQARCLMPFEALFQPIVEGLMPADVQQEDTPRYELPEGSELVIERMPKDGHRACSLVVYAPGAEAAFDAWIAVELQQQRYVPAEDMPGTWHSFEWIEPVLAVQKRRGDDGALILRVVETELES